MKGYPTVYDGVLFIEGGLEWFNPVQTVSVDLSFKFGAQLKNLNDVKSDMALKARQANCNCISNFKYGQKSRWLAIDDVAFFGDGVMGNVSSDEYDRILEFITQRDKR